MANKLDQIFQKKLRQRKFTPKDGDWAAMEKLMNSGSIPPPSNVISLNWIYSGLFVVLVGIGIYVGINSEIPLQKGETQTTNNIVSKSDLSTNTNSVRSQDLQKNPLFNKEENSESINFRDDKLINGSNTEKNSNANIISKGEDSDSNTNKKGEKTNTNIISKKNSPSKNILNTQKPINVIENQSLAKQSEAISSISENSDLVNKEENLKVNSTKSTSNGVEVNLFYESNKAEQNKNSDNEFTSSNKVAPKIKESHFIDSQSNYSHLLLSSTPIQTFEDHQIQQSIISPVFDDPQKIKALKAKRSLPIQLSVAALGEVSYITKNIKGDSEYLSLVSIRNSQEKNIVSGGFGLEVQASYKNIGLSSGITLGQYGENIQYEEKYKNEWEVSSTEIGDTLWTEDIIFTYDSIINPIDSNNYIVFIVDSSFVTVVDSIFYNTVYDSTQVYSEIGLSEQNGRSTIQYWEIPLYFSYKIAIGDFYLSPGVGVTIGFLKVTKGYYMGEDLISLIPFNTQYAVFKKTIVNGLINFGFGYRIGNRYSIEVTPSYRFNLTNILDNPGMIQKYSSISLQFKLRYYF